MNASLPTHNSKSAVSLVEVVATLALLGVLSLIGFATYSKIIPATKVTKLESDVNSMNSAIRVYQHSGGDLSTANNAHGVIAKLKTMHSQSSRNSFAGFTGASIDLRIELKEVDSNYRGKRAIYDPLAENFKVTSEKVDGYLFELNKDADNMVAVEEARQGSAFDYDAQGGWVWEYEDTTERQQLQPTQVALTPSIDLRPKPIDVTGTDDHKEPSASGEPDITKLSPPIFSIASNVYQLDEYPLQLTLSDPNENSGKIVYSIVSKDAPEWQYYSGQIQVSPGDKISAYVESINPVQFRNSDPNDEFYDWEGQLPAPSISANPLEIDARKGITEVTIDSHSDLASSFALPRNSFSIQYNLVPLAVGEGSETGWQTYTAPFQVGGPQFPRGFDVVARTIGNSSSYSASSESRQTVSAFYELDPPIIDLSLNSLHASDLDRQVQVKFENPNPNGSSAVEVQLYNVDGVLIRDWFRPGDATLTLDSNFSEGSDIIARSAPLDPYYRRSINTRQIFDGTFFGTEVTGNTIFILDSSKSMAAEGRMKQLQAAMSTILTGFDEENSFAIIDYDGDARILSTWGPATDTRKAEAQAGIANLSPFDSRGGTHFHAALELAASISSQEVGQVVLLSDGQPWNPDNKDNPKDTSGIIDLVLELQSIGVDQVDTIGFGSDAESSILEEIARAGQGESVTTDEKGRVKE